MGPAVLLPGASLRLYATWGRGSPGDVASGVWFEDDGMRPRRRWSLDSRCVSDAKVDVDLLEDIDSPRARSRGQAGWIVDTVGAGLPTWTGSGWRSRLAAAGNSSRELCEALTCRGREKFPTIIVLDGDVGVLGVCLRGDGIGDGYGADGADVSERSSSGLSAKDDEPSVEADERSGSTVVMIGCEERPGNRGADAGEEGGERRSDLLAKLLGVGEIGLVGAVDAAAEATEVWTETGTEALTCELE